VGEAQHVAGAVAQDFQQEPGLALAGVGAVGGGVGQSGQRPVAEPAQ